MDTLDLEILAWMKKRENYEQYKDIITKQLCVKESWTLVGSFGKYFDTYPEVEQVDTAFKLWFRVTAHPGWKTEEHLIYGKIIDNVLSTDPPDGAVFTSQLEKLQTDAAIRGCSNSLELGTITTEEYIQQISQIKVGNAGPKESTIQEFTLDQLAAAQLTNAGLYWRLEDLNKSVGPVKKGDFVIVAKRPEVGGTSFLVSEMTYMLEQMPNESKAIIFNNEEAPDKVYTRLVSSALGVDHRTLLTAPAHYDSEYQKWLGGREIVLCHDTSMTTSSIKKILTEKEYGLIGINVLLKVGGTKQKEDHDKFQYLGEECRRLAQSNGPTIAVVQADPSAEGLRFIPQDRIYKSKTALQGEADVLIMIGRDEDEPDFKRFINVAKNKLPPALCTDISVKHIKSEVKFDIDTGRFESVNYKGNSRDAT